VASFIGSPAMNFLPANVTGTDGRAVTMTFNDQSSITLNTRNGAASAKSSTVEIGIRPEHVHLTDPNDPKAVLKGRTTIVEQLGNATFVYVDTPCGAMIVEGDGSLVVGSGVDIGISIDPDRAHIFGADGLVL